MRSILERNLWFMGYPDYSVDTECNVWSIGYNNTKEIKKLKPRKIKGYDKSYISKSCRGIYKTSHNFIWKYKDSIV